MVVVLRLRKRLRSVCPWQGGTRLSCLLLMVSVCAMGCAGSDRQSIRSGQIPHRSWFGTKGTPWTILCVEIRGPARATHIDQLADSLKRSPGVVAKDVYTQHDEDGYSRLYYGVYKRRTVDVRGKLTLPKKLIRDLDVIKFLGTPDGKRYFLAARMVRLPIPNAGNPAWALSNAKGMYTLQVAVFEPTDDHWDYKTPASELCAFLRKQGHEAYYHHSDSSSAVTVGAFGSEALIQQPRGLPKYSAAVRQLQASDELFKYNHLNGAIYRARSDKGTMIPVYSRLVKIPQREDAL